jgi:hypothetical protein
MQTVTKRGNDNTKTKSFPNPPPYRGTGQALLQREGMLVINRTIYDELN